MKMENIRSQKPNNRTTNKILDPDNQLANDANCGGWCGKVWEVETEVEILQ